MSMFQLILLVLQLLKQFKDSQSAETFASNVEASGKLPQASGAILKWLWENREEIIAFIQKLFAPKDPEVIGDDPQVQQIRDLANELSA